MSEIKALELRQSSSIELYSRIDKPLDAIEKIGTFLAKSGMFGCERIEQGMVLAMECLATNKPPSVIARSYHIMDGKLSKKALAALAEFRAAGGKHKWIKDGTDGKEASLELTMDGNTITSTFTIDDAKRMGAMFKSKAGNDTNWTKSPANMLRARCISNGVAMLAPEIFAGDVEDDDSPSPRKIEPLLTDPVVVASEPVVEVDVVKEAQAVDLPKPATVAETVTQSTQSSSPAVSSSVITAEADASGKLTVASQQAIVNAIGAEHVDALQVYLVKQGWLTEGQNLSNLSVPRANKILLNPAGVIRTITAK